MEGNLLDSTLPSEIGRLTSLLGFFLSDNNLSGTMPAEVALLASPAQPPGWGTSGLQLDSNLLEGSIPSEIGLLFRLPALLLQGNQLSGEVPQELFDLAEGGLLVDLSVTWNPLLSAFISETVCLVDMQLDFDCSPVFFGCACACEQNNTG